MALLNRTADRRPRQWLRWSRLARLPNPPASGPAPRVFCGAPRTASSGHIESCWVLRGPAPLRKGGPVGPPSDGNRIPVGFRFLASRSHGENTAKPFKQGLLRHSDWIQGRKEIRLFVSLSGGTSRLRDRAGICREGTLRRRWIIQRVAGTAPTRFGLAQCAVGQQFVDVA